MQRRMGRLALSRRVEPADIEMLRYSSSVLVVSKACHNRLNAANVKNQMTNAASAQPCQLRGPYPSLDS